MKSLDEQIRDKALEWGEAMLQVLKAHQAETRVQVEHKVARQKVLKIEEEMSALKQETMRINLRDILAKPAIPMVMHEA